MKVDIEISDDVIRDAIGGARISYWAILHTDDRCSWDRDTMRLVVIERDTNEECSAAKGTWRRALSLMAEKHGKAFGDLLSGNADSDTGDLLIQLACFGEHKYG